MPTGASAVLCRIQMGSALGAFGNGLTVPFLFVYVAQVKGLGAGTAGVVVASLAIAALLVLPFAGRVIDHRGPRTVIIVGVLAAALGSWGVALTSSRWPVIVMSGLLGAGMAVVQPALATMLVRYTHATQRSTAFTVQFFVHNLGLGAGGLVSGLVVDTSRPSSFLTLMAVQGIMFLLLGAVVAAGRVPRAEETAPLGDSMDRGWGEVCRDNSMVLMCLLGFALFFACYGQFVSGLSAYALEVTRVSPAMLGAALAANTAVIMLLQFFVLRLVKLRRRSRVIAWTGIVWGLAWAMAGASGLVQGDSQFLATTLLMSTYLLFGVGESMLAPTVGPLVSDLAPTRLVGRYNSAFALVKQLALAIGPAVSGLMVAAQAYAAYILMLVACSAVSTLLAWQLGRRLTVEQEGTQEMLAESLPESVARQKT
ncbi:MFS transporter [Streptomyces sp. NPDC021212]|uniref:MFS transporter n=1 Tax=Streptomyces sp. NPDC021212 TaxID=3365118 RepID=UPI0037AF93E8